MFIRKITIAFSVVALFAAQSVTATTRKVLFIGNSYTFTNNMPSMLDSIARSMGDTLIYDMSAPGGYTLQQHTTNTTTISKINAQNWDVVVIHEQSQMPSFPPSQVATDVYPYATRLDSMVHAHDTCTQTMFMMTWGHANGDPMNCPGYPAICTYDGMQQRLRESYLQMGMDNHAVVSPVGMAFKIMMDSMYIPWLFSVDSSHPIVPGSYLEASVLYASIFHKSNLNSTYTAGIAATDANRLQRIAKKVVFDSLSLWDQYGHYPYAGFTHVTSGARVTITSHSYAGVHHQYNYGDSRTDTAANPTHTYTTTGTYTITHTISNACFSETFTDTVHVVSRTGIENTTGNTSFISVNQLGGGAITFELGTEQYNKLEIFNCNGQLIRQYTEHNTHIKDAFVPGLYIYRWYSENGQEVVTGKIAVY